MTAPEIPLRDRIAAALAAHDCQGWGVDVPVPEHEFWDIWRESADVVLAVVQPELDRLTAEAASLRTVARAAAVLLHDTADRASGGIAIHAGVLRGAAKAIYDLTPDGP